MESDIYDADVMERVVPTENIQLMFHYRNPFVVFHSNKTVTKQPRSIISGLSDNYSDVSTNREAGVVFIRFHTTGACHFFNFPLSEIENQSVDLTDIFNTEIRQLEELLYFKDPINEKVAVIENFLIRRYSPIPTHDKLLIQKGFEIIKSSKGQTSVKYLSDCLHASPKTIERKFAKYFGKTTKQLIKLIRFRGVLHDFGCIKELSFTEHACNNGYFDQSHFIHDFKSYTGYTPKEFFARYPDCDINAD